MMMFVSMCMPLLTNRVTVVNVQLAGWALVGVGLWIHIFQESLLIGVLLKDNPTAPMLVIDRVPVTLIGCGVVITVVGFLGCCGACTESVCFLGFVSISLTLIVIISIVMISFIHQR